MHPTKTLREWYNIVHWTPLIKNQDVNIRYLGSYPPFGMVFKVAAMKKKDKMPIKCNICILPSVLPTFMRRTSIIKTLDFIFEYFLKIFLVTCYVQLSLGLFWKKSS